MSCSLPGLVGERMHHNNYFIRVCFIICQFMCLLGGDKAKETKINLRYNRKSRHVVTFFSDRHECHWIKKYVFAVQGVN
jgi:hypothetical protein